MCETNAIHEQVNTVSFQDRFVIFAHLCVIICDYFPNNNCNYLRVGACWRFLES